MCDYDNGSHIYKKREQKKKEKLMKKFDASRVAINKWALYIGMRNNLAVKTILDS